ncbi:MAG TPA: multicopper oxidase family protein [Ktedonosporobacter sp.]|jgi:FtsP/CotA-like multicopper oxidase with cupredoxin domain|nr:multicopper oxidase family protein [Ktedonosporobacter sp.]
MLDLSTKEKERLLDMQRRQREQPPRGKKLFMTVLVVLAIILIGLGTFKPPFLQDTQASTGALSPLSPPEVPSGAGVPAAANMGMPGAGTSITTLQAPLTSPTMKQFTLVAQNSIVSLDQNTKIAAWTFNGMAPGPTLRVQQGDLLVIHVVNHLSFSIAVHWHGIDVPNSQDGVAGVTQDAIKPGQTYTYRFIAPDPGTYWYHSHQFAYEETMGGLFGKLIVDPKTPTIHADVDDSVALHEWNGPDGQSIFTMDSTTQTLTEAAKPGQWVRLRIIETSNTDTADPHLLTLVGAPFQVVSLDGHDLNAPGMLNEVPLPIGTAQRYDLLFQMPAHGSVALVAADEKNNKQYLRTPSMLFGQGTVPTHLPPVKQWFDLTTYGQPASTAITPQSHFDVTSKIVLNNQNGSSLGRMGMVYTINGKVFPDTGMIMVTEGQLVKIQIDNQSDLYHPIHLHGHIFTVLARNGNPLTGSPVLLDTVLVPPHTRYDIGFLANNPGIWMLHCHNFLHANWGMDMMVVYNGYTTPYTVGTKSGNFPD